MERQYRFTVLLPVYNRPALVKEAINSVLNQRFADYELLVVDDGSTDSTPEVLRSFGDRIRILRQSNQGPQAARENAAKVATGEYYVLLDSDDLLLPGALATYDRVIRNLDRPPLILGSIVRFTGSARLASDDSGEVEVWRYGNFLAKDRALGTTCSQLVIRKAVADAAESFRPERTRFAFDTADILLSVAALGPCVAVKRPATVAYRLHESNTIRDVGFMLRNFAALLRLEREGRYNGGSAFRLARRGYIGGLAVDWAMRGFRAGLPGAAARVLLEAAPMIAVGAVRKLKRRLRQPVPAIHVAG